MNGFPLDFNWWAFQKMYLVIHWHAFIGYGLGKNPAVIAGHKRILHWRNGGCNSTMAGRHLNR
jgi:hypothetical protein